MKCQESVVNQALILFGIGGTLLAPSAVQAANVYKIQSIIKLGGTLGDTAFHAGGDFEVDSLNDAGQILFVTYTTNSEMMFQYAGGQITPMILPGGAAPSWTWPKQVNIFSPVSANQAGDAVIAVLDNAKGVYFGTYLWDYQAQKLSQILTTGTPVAGGLTIGQPSGGRPAINNHNEMALLAEVKDAAGKSLGTGLFFMGQDGNLVPVAMPGQDLPDGGTIRIASFASINDAGRIAFLVQRKDNGPASAYVWEKGTLTPVAQNGTDAPGGDKIADVWGAWVNNKNNNVLVDVVLNNATSGPHALFLFVDGQLKPVATPGQAMPDGSTFKTLPYYSVGFPNDKGEYPFFAALDKGTGAYLLAEDGTLSLILKSGEQTDLGQVVNVGIGNGGSFGMGLNNNGEVVLAVKIANTPVMVAELTPTPQ